MTAARGKDLARQITVAVSALIALVGGFIGSGAAGGTQIADAADGALQTDTSTIAPAGPAFAIWSVIYLGLAAYAVWQFLPGQRDAARQRRLGYPIAASMLLNAAWILSVQAGSVFLSVVAIIALLVVLVIAFLIAADTVSDGPIDAVVTDGTVGLYLGWVSVATIVNIAAWLADLGFDGGPLSPDTWGVVLALAAGVVGCGYALRSNGRVAPALSLCWGLAWVAVERITGEPESMPTAIAAIVAVVAVAAVTALTRVRSVATAARREPIST
ncbi:TspO/MBR family protein [Salinibacterium sp. GXW1014]|uniref:TspO/MBR family protein n=1 Tax=Salinibacterium sp. GXW1014 TaxID=3377838 RepID=UPI00383B1B09